MRRTLVLFAAICASRLAAAEVCIPLRQGTVSVVPFSAGKPACIEIEAPEGGGIQLSAEQPIDSTLRVSGKDAFTVDAFEFGKETITLFQPGFYRIEVAPVDGAPDRSWKLSMSRSPISLPIAEKWRRAEDLSTRAKRTRSLDDLDLALEAWKNLEQPVSQARVYLEQGDVRLDASDFVAARDSYERGLALCGPDERCKGEGANNSGWVSYQLGDLTASARRLREAAEIWRSIHLPMGEGRTLSNLGLLFLEAGDSERAFQSLEAARAPLARAHDIGGLARLDNNFGFYYQSLFEHERAIDYFQQAIDSFAARKQITVRPHVNQGRSYLALNKLPKAEEAFQLALNNAANARDISGRMDALTGAAQVLAARDEELDASRLLLEALDLGRSIHSRRGEALCLHLLGVEAARKGDFNGAKELLEKAAAIRISSGMRDEASESWFALAKVEYDAGVLDAAANYASRAVDMIETLRSNVPSGSLRAAYYRRKRRFFELLTDIAMERFPDGAEGLIASEQGRSRALFDLITTSGIATVAPRELMSEYASLQQQVSLLSARLTEADPAGLTREQQRRLGARRQEMQQQIGAASDRMELVGAQIRERVEGSAAGHPLTDASQLAAVIPSDTALLEYYLGERKSYLWLVNGGKVRPFILMRRAAIEKVAARVAASFGDIANRKKSRRLQSQFEADMRSLSEMLLGPISNLRLPPRLVLVADGLLHRVPLEALRAPGARLAIGIGHRLVRAPSAGYLLKAPPPRPVSSFARTLLAVGDPVMATDDLRFTVPPVKPAGVPGLARLPMGDEIKLWKQIVPPERLRILQDFDANAQELRRAKPQDFAVVHFSTHASIDDRVPESSHVTLSLVDRTGKPVDGYLHPYQLAELHFARSTVVLSACDSALGKEVGEGFAGFETSLLSAGASQLVLALTKIDADAASGFLNAVYRRFLSPERVSMEESLRHARAEISQQPGWSDPYYWASFTLVGALTPDGN